MSMTTAPPITCPHCQSPYKTFLSADYTQEVVNNTKVSIVTARRYRCKACGKTYSHPEKENES